MTVGLEHYLFVSVLLFSLGLAGVIMRRNLLIIYMSLELMLNAANLALVAFSVSITGSTRSHGVFIITVAARRFPSGWRSLWPFIGNARRPCGRSDLDVQLIMMADFAWIILFLPLLSAVVIPLFTNVTPGSALSSPRAVVFRFSPAGSIHRPGRTGWRRQGHRVHSIDMAGGG